MRPQGVNFEFDQANFFITLFFTKIYSKTILYIILYLKNENT